MDSLSFFSFYVAEKALVSFFNHTFAIINAFCKHQLFLSFNLIEFISLPDISYRVAPFFEIALDCVIFFSNFFDLFF